MTGSNMSAAIHLSRLKVTCEIIENPPQSFLRKKGRYSGDVDHDSKPYRRGDGTIG